MKTLSSTRINSAVMKLLFIVGIHAIFANVSIAQTETEAPEFNISSVVTALQADPVVNSTVSQAIADIIVNEELTSEEASRLLEELLAASDELPLISRAFIVLRFSDALGLADVGQTFTEEAFASAAASGRPFSNFLASQSIIDVPESPL